MAFNTANLDMKTCCLSTLEREQTNGHWVCSDIIDITWIDSIYFKNPRLVGIS